MKDGTGREFNDELSHFLDWYRENPQRIYVPLENSVHFVEGVTGLTIYRHGEYQVQLFTTTPNTVIPSHVHPNVDSYEVALSGMEFYLNDNECVLPMWFAQTKLGDSNISSAHYKSVRVLPNCPHGAKASDKGGSFMSVQRWLNGVEPTSVGNDWHGDMMGEQHNEQVTTKEVAA